MEKKHVTISIAVDVLEGLDSAAESAYLTRSGYICEAVALKQVIDKMRSMPSGDLRVEELLLLLNHQKNDRFMRMAKRLTWAELQD